MSSIVTFAILNGLIPSTTLINMQWVPGAAGANSTASATTPEIVACKNALTTFMTRQMDALKICTGEFRAKGGAEAENGGSANNSSAMLCVVKCALLREGFLSPDGKLDFLNAMKFLDTLPPKRKEKAADLIFKCHEFVEKIVPSDPTCAGYGPFFRCAFMTLNQLCTD